MLVFLFFQRRRARAAQARELTNPAGAEAAPSQNTPFWIFFAPAACDVLGTGIGGVGMMYISASVWQMMRGSLILFTSVLSVTMLRKKLYAWNWAAVSVSAVGLTLVGASAILDDTKKKGDHNSVPLGIMFTVLSQFFAACQMVLEEKFVKSYGAPPEKVVGSEGIWGILIMIILLIVFFYIPGTDAGSYENALDSFYMMQQSSVLVFFILLYLVSIAFFNFLGVTITGKLSAVHRVINDALRTIIVWAVQLMLFYLGSEKVGQDYGAKILPHSWMQLIGFLFMIMGSLLYNDVIRFPCMEYPTPPAEDANKPMITNDTEIPSSRSNLQEY